MTTTTDPTLVTLDPSVIKTNGNVRRNVGDLKSLTESVKNLGVLVPLIVRPDSDGGSYVLVAGQRRLAAATKAGVTVPCFVRATESEAQALAAQITENVARLALTDADEMAGYEQLRVLGLDPAAIAAQTGADPARVDAAVKVAASPKAAAVTAKHNLTLDQALVIAEFDDDNDMVKELTVAAVKTPRQFEHIASRARVDREYQRELDKVLATIEKKGLTPYTGEVAWWGASAGKAPTYLANLVNDAGKEITEAAHRKCPGHAVVVAMEYPKPRARYLCTDPATNGHKSQAGEGSVTASSKSDADKEKASEDRRAVLAGNKAWRAAEPVRLDFIRKLLARRTMPDAARSADIMRFVAQQLAGGTLDPYRYDKTLIDLLGLTDAKGHQAGVTEIRRRAESQPVKLLPLVLLAQVAANLEWKFSTSTWRPGDFYGQEAREWFAFLAGQGYELSDIEKGTGKK